VHQAELDQKEAERLQVEAQLKEFMGTHDKLLEEKLKL